MKNVEIFREFLAQLNSFLFFHYLASTFSGILLVYIYPTPSHEQNAIYCQLFKWSLTRFEV